MESVWNKYLEFECNVGDLQSMQKVNIKKKQEKCIDKILG